MIHKSGNIRGERVRYKVDCGCLRIPFPSDDDPDDNVGMCFDFPDDDMEDLLAVLYQMKDSEPDEYVEDEKDE